MNRLCRALAPVVVSFLVAGPVLAATVTTNESDLDLIFSQPGFTNPIDIRFLDQIDIDGPRFLNVDAFDVDIDTNGDGTPDTTERRSEMDFLLLGAIPQLAQSDRLYMIFVDSISVCGSGEDARIVGCALVGGNRQVIESGFAAGNFGAELQAHEMVHNLGVLPHTADGTGLMGATLNSQTDLSIAEIQIIEASALILRDENPLLPYLQVQPVRIFDAALEAVPVPPAGLALAGALGLLVLRRRRRRS